MSVYKKTRDPRIKKRGNSYHARFSFRGKRIQRALNTQSFEAAKLMVESIEKELILGRSPTKGALLFAEAWPMFLKDHSRDVRESTLDEYTQKGEKYYLPYFQDMRVDDINEEEWIRYVEWVHGERPGITITNHKKYFKKFLTWAKEKKLIFDVPKLYNPDTKLKEQLEEAQGTSGVGKVYSDDEVLIQLEWCKEHSPKLYLAIKMAFLMGMRRSEISQLSRDRIDLKNNTIRLRPSDTKTKKGRLFPIHPEVIEDIRSYLEHGKPHLFPSSVHKNKPMDKDGFKKDWARLKKETGVKGRFHDFRHTFLTRVFQNPKAPHLVICEYAGLSVAVAQKTYLHLKPDDLGIVTDSISLKGLS